MCRKCRVAWKNLYHRYSGLIVAISKPEAGENSPFYNDLLFEFITADVASIRCFGRKLTIYIFLCICSLIITVCATVAAAPNLTPVKACLVG